MDRKPRALLLALAGLTLVAAVLLYGRCRGASPTGDSAAGGTGATAPGSAAQGEAASGAGQAIRLGGAPAGPGAVEGFVLDVATGAPVPYVDIIFRQGGAETTANSGEQGQYDIELAAGEYQVRAIGDGVVGLPQPVLRVAGGPAPVRFDIEVQRLATVRGQVVDHRGGGVAGATVVLMPASAAQGQLVKMGDVLGSLTTDPGGGFELEVLAGGDVALEAESAGLRGRAVLDSVAPGSERQVVIRLEQGASLAGIVRAPSGAPVAGAQVHVSVRANGMEQRHELTCGDDGRFAIDPVLAGAAVLEARAEGYAQAAPTGATLAPGKEAKVELRLQEPLAMAGRVVDAAGEPVAGVRVRAGRAGTRMKALETHTAADGTFAFDAVDRGPYWVSGFKEGYAVATREGVVTPIEDLVLRLPGFGGVRGRVVGADARPLGEFTIRVARFRPHGVTAPKPGGGGTRVSPDDGRFELSPLEPGAYDLVVSATGLAPVHLHDVEVPADGWAEVEVTMGAGGRIAGRVTSAKTARPLAMARVAVAGAGDDTFAFTDRDGRFAIEDVSPGRRSLVVTHPGFLALTLGGVEVAAGAARTVQVALTPSETHLGATEVSGVGVVIDRRGSDPAELYVREVIAGSPAEGAGVKARDVLVAIDGASVAGLRPEAAADRLRGAEGTRVVIEIARGGQNLRIEVERARFHAPDPDRGLVAMR